MDDKKCVFLEVTLGEGVAGTGFEISFKCDSFFFGLKSKIGFYFPRMELCCMWYFSGVMFGKAGF